MATTHTGLGSEASHVNARSSHSGFAVPRKPNYAKFRKNEATDVCVASGSVSHICSTFLETQGHPLAPHLIFIVVGKIKLEEKEARTAEAETFFTLTDRGGLLRCKYTAIDTPMPTDVTNDKLVRVVGTLRASKTAGIGGNGQPTMQVIKVRVAKRREIQEILKASENQG